MQDQHNEYRHGLGMGLAPYLPPSSSDRGWAFEPEAPRPRIVPMALTSVVAALIFILPLIAWCVL